MIKTTRRNFLGGALAIGAATITRPAISYALKFPQTETRQLDSRIEVLINEPVGTINPELYGHFVEHLGGVVYDGIWVGEQSRIPNVNGIRSSLVEALKRVRPGVIRWPGGCFADSYDWTDGIGPRKQRPRRTNFWLDAQEWAGKRPEGPWNYDTNEFGTNEFLTFCKLVGAEPYLAVNVRGLGAESFYKWVEYCNSPAGSTTAAETREGAPIPARDPFKVRYWGIGNESWGCGGNLTAAEYSAEYRKFTAAAPGYGMKLNYIASGANGGDLEWTRGFFSTLAEKSPGLFNSLFGFGLHSYSWNVSGGKTNDWVAGKGDALTFDPSQYYELLKEADKVERLINDHWNVMGQYDRQHRARLIVDEWGAWYRPGTEANPSHLLGQQSTMRDAVLAGLTLNIFNRHADKVAMANIAQLVNCLASLFLAHEDKFAVTPTYHVFEMYVPHQGGKSVRTEVVSPRASYQRDDKPSDFWGLQGSASIKDKELTLTVVNSDLNSPREAEISVPGARIASLRVRVLSAENVHAHNSFENPKAVEPRNDTATVDGDRSAVYRFPPSSVTRLQLTLS